ncbi:mitochondrial transmembrane amino acid transporter protein [Andalucia godoyi]|uniref:Mitochondrial transmembrane amino acid transporter protein n=1 Tax=Andalucia godoyi TaxID=505711 RepID=A0A8K0AID8_ANDGO|nr:mitochondrial transmembrane amino acid transporter protein [Andalucia godoyi]|eukprot:ANDGO_01749.mRNA.1 mitochondrial transmembrane amino acid transporter protein (possible sodium-coupled neutral amino acid transporter)
MSSDHVELGELTSRHVSSSTSLVGAEYQEQEDAQEEVGDGEELGEEDGENLSAIPAHEATGTIVSSTVNLANSIIGAGVLSLPLLFKDNGAGMMIFLLVVGAVLSAVSLQLLVYVGHLLRIPSYEEIAFVLFGKYGRLWIVISMIIINLGACTAYTYVMTDVLEQDLQSFVSKDVADTIFSRAGIMTMLSVFVLWPLACLRRMNSLRFTSYLSMAIIVFFLFALIAECSMKGGEPDADSSGTNGQENDGGKRSGSFHAGFSGDGITLFVAIPVISFAYTCHSNLYPIQFELKQSSPGKMAWVISMGSILCFVVYSVIGFCAYYLYWDNTSADVLVNMGKSGQDMFKAVRLVYVVSLATTYPFSSFPMRSAIDELFWAGKPSSAKRSLRLSTAIVAVVLLITLFVPSLTIVYSIAGAIASTSVCYILPPLMFLKTHGGYPQISRWAFWQKLEDVGERSFHVSGRIVPMLAKKDFPYMRMVSIALFPLGIMLSIISTVVLIIFGDG